MTAMSAVVSGPPRRSLRRLPELTSDALRLAWRAGRRELVVITAVQAVGGLSIGGQLLAVRSVLAEVVRADRVGDVDVGAIAPGLVVLVVLVAVMSIATVVQ